MNKGKILLITALILLFILPYIGSFMQWNGPPPGFGLFPAQKLMDDPGFNQIYFNIAALIAVFIGLFLLFPRLFGFKKNKQETKLEMSNGKFPIWFLPGLIVLAISWFFMWGRFTIVQPIDHYTFVPLWWGFIFVLDGFVYKRNGGRSLIATKPNTMKLLAIVSSVSWFVFEFLNFFVGNWYYPNNEIFTNFGNISWQLLSYTTVLPAIFEWYSLLKTFKPLTDRYSNGLKISISKPFQIIALVLGLVLSFLMGYFPFVLFWVLWVALVPVLVPAMSISGYWTPFKPIKKGDWSYVNLIAIATLLNGFFWEFWNFGSEWFHDSIPTNPNYWKYSVPYLDKYHIFSEMPILGYFGYLFFGIGCWVLWLVVAYLFNFNPSIDLNASQKD